MRRYTETEQRTRVFKIDDYSMQLEFLDAYRFIESATFTVGGHEWRIAFYPNGAKEGYEDHASVFLKMLSKLTDYRRVFFDFRVTNPLQQKVFTVSVGNLYFVSAPATDTICMIQKMNGL
jgi:hypothetical protein